MVKKITRALSNFWRKGGKDDTKSMTTSSEVASEMTKIQMESEDTVSTIHDEDMKQVQGYTSDEVGVPNDPELYENTMGIEFLRCKLDDVHVFNVPTLKPPGGWKGATWEKEIWQGKLKIMERGGESFFVLFDRETDERFAVCLIEENSVEKCIDTSRYFVVTADNADGRSMTFGIAFNKRVEAFNFYTATIWQMERDGSVTEDDKPITGGSSKKRRSEEERDPNGLFVCMSRSGELSKSRVMEARDDILFCFAP